MNEVGGSESGTGLRAIKSSRSSDANFEYDDSEWDVGIGNLIIDLDADIEKNNEANRNNNNSSSGPTGSISATSGSGSTSSTGNTSNLSVTSPGGGGSSNPQMHIPLTSSSGSNSGNSKSAKSSSSSANTSKGSNSTDASVMEHSSVVDKGLKMKIKRTKTGTKSDAKHEIVKNDVVGSSNGTGSSSSGSNSSGYSSNNKSSLADSIVAKNSHSSHKDKDKLLIKDAHLHDNSHESASSINSKVQPDNSSTDHPTTAGGKVKTPRKGSTKEKKVKNSNVGNSGNSKKDDKNSNEGSGKNSISNSNSGSASSTGSHAKDNKEFFTTTVNLNVPNVIPTSSSSAFVKTTGTIKVPTAPNSSALSTSGGNSGGLHNAHSSSSGSADTSSSSSSSNSRNLSSANSNSNSVSSNPPWAAASSSKGGDKGRLSPSVNVNNASEKTTGSSYKKARAFAAAAAAASSSDKSGSGSSQDESSSGSHGSSSSNASYRNPGALSINSATDLSSSSSSFIQGSQPGNVGSSFGSSKETGKCGRNATSSSASATTTQDVCVGTSVGTVTEPDCLGPCEPGTTVTLEGIVWHETESGVLVVNVTWRGKTYVGTLIDCTKNDWAPPRFCDSPTSDLEMRTTKNRGKRGRAQAATPVNEPVVADTRSANAKLRNGAKGRRGSNNTVPAFVAPASPVKPDSWPKRKTRGSENESQEESNPKTAKRIKVSKDGDRKDRRSHSPAADNEKSGPSSPQLIECPEPNCSKKYKHINGLRYHQSHAHTNNFVAAEDSDSNMSTASNTNASAAPDPPSSNSAENIVEPMVVDSEIPDGSSTSQPASVPDDSVTAPSTPVKKSSVTPPTITASPKVDDKIYDLSSDADLNPAKDAKSPTHDGPEPYSSKSGKAGAKSQTQNKEASNSDLDSKLSPENLSKDSTTTTSPSATNSSSAAATPLLNPRTPILTVPVVPYMSLQSRNLAHGHVVNVPRVDTSHNSRDSENSSPIKNSGSQSVSSKNAPWQPHAQSGLSSHGSHVMNTSPTASSITVPLNIPMNIPEKLGGGSMKDKGSNSDQPSSKKNKHKKKSKDKDKEREGKSKDKDKVDMGKGINVPMPGGPSDYSRSSSLFHNSNMGSDSMRSKDMGSGDDNDSSRKNSLDNRDDPQSPAYSDISDANDSGPDGELNVGGAIKEGNCKGLVIPTAEIKKDPINIPGSVPVGGPPFQSFYNHNLHSPYLDSLSYAATRQAKESPEQRGPPPGAGPEDTDKVRSNSGPIKHSNILPANIPVQVPSTSGPPGGGNEDGRRSPKMDFHPKYPYSNYYSYPYSSFHPYADHPSFPPNAIPSENSFNSPGQGRMFPGMEEKDRDRGENSNNSSAKGPGKSVEKDEVLGNVQIKQEPVDREERRPKEKPQTSAFAMNIDQDKNIDIKSEFGGSDHGEPKLVPPYMSNSSSKHMSKEHKRSSDDSRHERRHEGKDMDGKSDNIKSSRSSSSMSEKSKGSSSEEPSETKERKDDGVKPTMETTGPPPPPTASAYYLPQGYLPGNPFGIPFDPNHPLYRQMMVPNHYPGSPYMHPSQIPRFPSPGGPTPLPEDLSRPSPPGNPSKALDILQHHAAQYYNSHKIHELQERALKSPSPQVSNQRGPIDREGPGGALPSSSPGHPLGGPGLSHPGSGRSSMGSSGSGNSAMPKPADLSKDSKPIIGPGGSIIPGVPTSDNVRTPPPTQHHVHSHTHHHTHVGIGYPIIPSIPAVSPQYSPHYGVLATPPAAPSVIPSFPPQKPS